MLPRSSLLRATGAVTLIFLVVCVSLSNQLSGLSLQSSKTSGVYSPQLLRFNLNEEGSRGSGLEREKRDVQTETAHPRIVTNVTLLNDSHNSLIVYWAGKDVIICLAKDVNANSASTLHISRDYGATFEDATHQLNKDMPDGVKPVLDKFFNHPTNNGKFIFTDVQNHVIFTTDNYGAEFRRTSVLFVPDEILFDPYAEETIVAYEKNTTEKHMWVSKDFGVSWTMVQEYVKSVSWDESVLPAKLYIQREEPDQKSAVLTSESAFIEHGDFEVVFVEVEEFEIKDEYMFATKRGVNDTLELWISYKRGPFLQALFPTRKHIKNYHIADVNDGQMFVCVTHENSVSDLYVGSRSQSSGSMENPRFSLSLGGIVFYKPNMTWSESWIDDVTDDTFVELHRVEGLRGVYIANVLKNNSQNTNNKINFNEIVSKVTFDNGGEWEVLKPPELDDDGQPLYCHLIPKGGKNAENCSLQINQRLSELYPVTRSVPVLSRKSAVGIIMATGTVNNSLKGHQGVFMSTDGAVTWKHLLQGNYLFGFGDHGGVIVAVKFYKLGDATDSLLYSTNEGETWKKYKFYSDKVRVLGLMTEPGENTTVFFVFGSISKTQAGKVGHSWILIKVDLFNAFEGKKCEPNDYKLWSPWDSKPGRDCLLGKKDHYERRIPSHDCYNGRAYERLVNTTKCLCDRIDFECDFGYIEDELDGQICKKDVSDFSPGVKPQWCKPGDLYYNITRGYRKIPGDECVGGDISRFLPETKACAVSNETEFMLVAKRDSVLRIDLNDFNRTEVLPLLHVRAVISMDYDMHSGHIYWADVNRDNIMRLRLDGNSEPETLVTADLKSVEGLAFDWIAKNLYYCDAANGRVEVIRTDARNMGRMRKIILDKTNLDKPRGIAIHPEKGYLFWTDWSSNSPCIGRSWLDGSNVKRIVENPTNGGEIILRWPNGITIDYQKNTLYWVDAFLDHLALSDFDGKNVKIFMKNDLRLKHPFAISVYKDTVYWDDWSTHSIFGTRKNSDDPAKEVFLVTANHTRLMDLKIYGPGKQVGSNACSNHSCSHLCLSFPGGQNFTCECPDGLKKVGDDCVCPDGKPTGRNGQCSTTNCNGNATFTCKNSFCIPLHWKCDGDDDCGDNSDEDSATCDPENRCNPAQFQCVTDKKCIPDGWQCDYDNDCADGSDEHNCTERYPTCDNVTHFQCANKRCILSRWKCDGDNDCMDNSDEQNCTTTAPGACALNEFRCESNNRCISDQWRCDGDNDCADNSDEKGCAIIACPDYKFHCQESNQCIMESWHCDGDMDCNKGEDERNCSNSVTTPPAVVPFPSDDCSKLKQTFQCAHTKKCIPTSWKCDGQYDCGPDDRTDELGCELDKGTTNAPAVTVEPHQQHCPLNSWQCISGECIRYGSLCDGYPDCEDHSDEQSCHDPSKGCSADHIRCGLSNVCIHKGKVCDGKKDCPNNADESACFLSNSTTTKCNSGQHVCDEDVCVALSKMCNGKRDCIDGTDEISCSKFQKVYQVDGIQVNPEGVDASEIEIEWWVDPDLSRGKQLYYIPSYCEVKSNDCVNASKISNQAKYKFTKLVPFTRYNVTVYVGYGSETYPPSVYKLVNTIEYDPSPPYHLELRQPNVDELCASWKKPHTPNGVITQYILHFSPPAQPASVVSLNESLCLSNKQSDPPFQAGEKYTFWVIAENSVGRSEPSEIVTYVFKGDAGRVVDVKCKDITETSVTLTWTTSSDKSVQHPRYNISVKVASTSYPFITHLVSDSNDVKVKRLAPDTPYEYEVVPIHEDGIRGVSFKGKFQTKGDKLPSVDGLTYRPSANGTNMFEVYWIKPVNSKPGWKYAVYYGKTIAKIVESNSPMKVSGFPALLKDLEACEDYFVDVAVIENDGIGPLTEKPIVVKTTMDVRAPPKRLRIKDPEDYLDDVRVTVAWESPCPVMDKKIGYNITLRDSRLNHEYGLSNVSYSNSSYLEQRIDIQYGGQYEVTVSTSAVGGRSSAPVLVQGPDIPYPLRLRQCAACSAPTVVWELPLLPKKVTKKGNITYVVWLSRDAKFAKANTFSTNEAVFPFKDVLEEGIYFIAVSIKDAEGLESPKSSPIILQGFGTAGGSSAVTLDERSLVGIVVTVIVVLAILIAALSVFIVRHKRLQTSFLNFASSHYSTQSGSATFQQNMEEEQDSPVIRGFSDDEPLLVA